MKKRNSTKSVNLKVKKIHNLILFFIIFSGVSCYGQYNISGYINSNEKKTVYISLLKYNEENLISDEQVLFSTKTDSAGFFEIKGQLLSVKNKLYRIHSNIDENDTGLELSNSKKSKNYHNFIFSNTDSIFFPDKKQVWFSKSQNSNLADKEWRNSLEYELKLFQEYAQTENSEAILQAKNSFSKELKSYSINSLSSPLVKLLSFVRIKSNIVDLEKDFKKDSRFYSELLNELNEYYSDASYYSQFKEEISILSISSFNKSYKLQKKINYLLGALFLISLVIIFFLLKKLKVKKKKVINNEVSTLTNQEGKIAKYICEGMSNKEIASKLFISSSTVKTHIRNIYSKLEVSKREELIEKLKNHP